MSAANCSHWEVNEWMNSLLSLDLAFNKNFYKTCEYYVHVLICETHEFVSHCCLYIVYIRILNQTLTIIKMPVIGASHPMTQYFFLLYFKLTLAVDKFHISYKQDLESAKDRKIYKTSPFCVSPLGMAVFK